MRKDEWIQSAMTDDTMVAELIMRISSDSYASSLQLNPDTTNNFKNTTDSEIIPLIKWGLRKPRSRLLLMRYNNRQIIKKENDLTRASPTTPFSWSPGSSISGASGSGNSGVGSAVDCYEESSRPSIWSSNHNSRSKVTATIGPNANRSRKKQKVADLKEEESFLLKEKINLKKELVTLKNTYEGSKAVNDSLKRIKLDLKTRSTRETGASCDASIRANYSDQFRNAREIIDETPIFRTRGKFNGLEYCEVETKLSSAVRGSFFVLPDLNMPLEDDSCADVVYGLS
ncbi:hypothetical protein C5167_034112 [Papaver somniferum]|uniref:Uncharacterized protein n=1 Tax=Papaver somniferum TaxID=3469 RepID=A0A4Y7KC67_PAPSO|nr:uncharacterized protein LOC113299120 isoform X1 [Papaver somniferum]RZC70964.1 hypothetical protein C5167_034112 [Papaver somniferum]